MFYVVHYTPIHRDYQEVIAAISNFETDNEDFVKDLFNSTYVGQEIIFISRFSSIQQAHKHISDNGHYIKSMETLFLPIRIRNIESKKVQFSLFN